MVHFAADIFLFAVAISLGLCASDRGSYTDQKISIEVLKAFEQKFPQAVAVEWEKEGRYYVADFRAPLPEGQDGVKYELEAWFDSGANLPRNAKTALTTTGICSKLVPPQIFCVFLHSVTECTCTR